MIFRHHRQFFTTCFRFCPLGVFAAVTHSGRSNKIPQNHNLICKKHFLEPFFGRYVNKRPRSLVDIGAVLDVSKKGHVFFRHVILDQFLKF